MLDFWLNILGVNPDRIPEGARIELLMRHAPRSWQVFLFVGVVLALLYGAGRIYREESPSCPPAWKVTLSLLRGGVILIAALVFLGPALAYSTRATIDPYVMVLLDDSLSMSIRDRYREEDRARAVAEAASISREDLRSSPPSRAEIVDRLLSRRDHPLVRALTSRGKVKVMTFSDRIRARDSRGAEPARRNGERNGEDKSDVEVGEAVPPLRPEGRATDMARAIREARRLAAGNPLAGLVIVSDGQNTAGGDPLSAAARAGETGTPIFTVGVGDPGEPVNLRIADLWAPENVFEEDPMRLEASVQIDGVNEGTGRLELRVRKADSSAESDERAGTLLEEKTVPLQPGLRTFTFEHTPGKADTYLYTVRLAPHEDELIDSDNMKSTVVNVVDEKVRVLLVSGGPSWGYRLVKNLLIRDATIDLSCWLQSMSPDMQQGGNTPIEHLPRNRRQLLEYDAVLMLDPDPAEFNQQWVEEIKNFMENHAGGFFWMSGPQYSVQFLTHGPTREIRDVLPVRFRGLQRGILEAMAGTRRQEWPLKVRSEGVDHPILQLKENPGDVRAIWEGLPGVYWSFPAHGPKPAAQVLLEHSNPHLATEMGPRPLLVTGQYGPGRSAYAGFQSTWRWRRRSERYFQNFWIQTVRYLVQGRLIRGRTRGRVLTNRDLYSVGDRVSVSTRLYDTAYRPLDRPTVKARLIGPREASEEITLRTVPDSPGEYQASTTATYMGLNEIEIILQNKDGEPVKVQRQFTVEMPDVESADPRMNVSLLKKIARRSGGKYFPMNKTAEIPDAIPDRREITVVHGRPIPL